MKKLTTLIVLFLLYNITTAQKVEWVKTATPHIPPGTNFFFKKVIPDGTGNMYAFGTFQAVTNYNGTILTPINAFPGGHNNTFIMKLDTNGNVLWHKVLSNGISFNFVLDIATTFNNNLTLLINSTTDVFIDNDTIPVSTPGGAPSALIVSFLNNGTYAGMSNTIMPIWEGFEKIYGNNNGLYILGGGKIWKWNSSLTLQWQISTGSVVWDNFKSLDFQSDGNIIATGVDATNFPGFSIDTIVHSTSQTTTRVFYTKINSNTGNVIWLKMLGNATDISTLSHIKIDGTDNIYMAGFISPNNSLFYFGSDTIGNPGIGTNSGPVFVLKADPAGDPIWGRDFYGGTIGIDQSGSTELAVDDSSNSYIFPSVTFASFTEPGQAPYFNFTNPGKVCYIKTNVNGVVQFGKSYNSANAATTDGAFNGATFINGNMYVFGTWVGNGANEMKFGCHRVSDAAYIAKISKSAEPVPLAGFDFVLDEGKAYFTNTTLAVGSSTSYSWDFGDGQTSIQVNPLHIYNKGSYIACLTATDSCGTNQICNTVIVQGIESVSPNKIADVGYHTLLIKGGFASAPNSIVFRKTGSADIIPDTVLFYSSGIIQANLKLNSVDTGYYDLYYQSPTLIDTLWGAIHIQTSDSILPTVAVSGASLIRTNTISPVKIIVTNESNVTYYGLPIHIFANPDLNITLINSEVSELIVQQILDTAGTNFFYVHPDSTVNDSILFGSYLIPKISAGSSFSINVYVSNSNIQQNIIRAFIGKPYFSYSDLQTLGLLRMMSPCNFLPPCLQCAMDLAGYVPGVGCGTGAFNLGCSIVNEINEPKSDHLWDLVANLAGTVLGCTGGTAAVKALEKTSDGLLLASDLAQNAQAFLGAGDDCGGDDGCGPGNDKNFNFSSAGAVDPNYKTGPIGNNVLNFIDKYRQLNYTINFENLDTATATVAEAVIIDTLDLSVFDVNTFSFSGFGYSDTMIDFLSPQNYFAMEINLQPNKNSILRVIGTIDTLSGVIKWTFTSLDPTSRDIISTINDGFLNPNITSPEGQAFVNYQVKLRPTVPHLQLCHNTANIIFDSNTPITTNTFLNTVDTVKPISSVFALAVTSDTVFTVKWIGTDVDAGISSYDLYVSENDSSYYRLLSLTQKDSVVINGSLGSKYEFYTIATDHAGNIEDAPVDPDNFPDAVTTITIGLNDLSQNNFFNIKPNPANEIVEVTLNSILPDNITVQIMDLAGKVVLNQNSTGSNSVILQVGELANGTYLINLRSEKFQATRKMVINH